MDQVQIKTFHAREHGVGIAPQSTPADGMGTQEVFRDAVSGKDRDRGSKFGAGPGKDHPFINPADR
ncbi:MAG: hypothetical protein MZV49_23730 [Rhodopseudomonas palustris]|nr:hypothetical protein [Rhodopseudomonas palustris]